MPPSEQTSEEAAPSATVAARIRSGVPLHTDKQAFDALAALGARACSAPLAAISVMGPALQHFNGVYGLEMPDLPHRWSLCAHVAAVKAPFVSANLADDLPDHPIRKVFPHVIAYAGVPLVSLEGEVVGAVCVADIRARVWTTDELAQLRLVATQAAANLELAFVAEKQAAALSLAERANERHRLLVSALSDVVWELDFAADTLDWSERLARAFGHQPSGFRTDLDWRAQLIHPDDRERVLSSFRACRDGGERHWECEYRFRTGSGSYAIVVDRASIVRDAEGLALRAVGAMLDVSSQRQAEERIKHADRLLALGTLAASVAHEINNPLAYVIANLEVVSRWLRASREWDDDALEVVDALADAREGAERIGKMVASLKVVSRAPSGDRAMVDVNQSVKAGCAIVNHKVLRRARLLIKSTPVPAVLCDEARMSQVIVNLVVNAAQAIPEGCGGHGEINVSTFEREGQVIIAVADNGKGMTPELQARIFEPFFTTKPIGEGTGLGLSICKEIISEMAGTLLVRSSPGVGTTFEIVLPPAELSRTPGPDRPQSRVDRPAMTQRPVAA